MAFPNNADPGVPDGSRIAQWLFVPNTFSTHKVLAKGDCAVFLPVKVVSGNHAFRAGRHYTT
jgi:hypothetical protein